MSDNTTVYMVTDGEYSGYHVMGIFSTEEKAKTYIDEYRKYYQYTSAEIEPIVLDEVANDFCQTVYAVQILTASGSFYSQSSFKRMAVPGYSSKSSNGTGCSGLSTKGYDHALKLAVEARQEYLRKYT